MAAQASFDISTGADLQEVHNAVNQALKEIAQRYDFKGTSCTIELDRREAIINRIRAEQPEEHYHLSDFASASDK